MAIYKKFGIEDADEVSNQSWDYLASSTNSTDYAYNSSEIYFGATETTEPAAFASSFSTGHVRRVFDQSTTYYWWEVIGSVSYIDWYPDNFTIESAGSNFTSFNPDCIVLDDGTTQEVVYGVMPTITAGAVYYNESSDYVRVYITIDTQWDYGSWTYYIEIGDGSPDSGGDSGLVSGTATAAYTYLYSARATYGSGTKTVYVRFYYDGVYSNTVNASVTLPVPTPKEWIQTGEFSSPVTGDINISDDYAENASMAKDLLESAYPAANQSLGYIGVVDNMLDIWYEFEVQ